MLKNKISIYIPTTTNAKEKNEEAGEYYKNRALEYLAKRHGGATAIESEGAYIADNGEMITEKIFIVYAFTEFLNEETKQSLERLAEFIKEEMVQECVLIEINGQAKFI
jgi:hypothetical protein